MADTDAQAVEILVVAQRWNDIPQAVVAAVSAALFETCAARWDVQLIVGDKNLLRRNFEKPGHGSHRHTAAIHEIGGNEQPHVVAGQGKPSGQTVKPGLRL